MKYIYLFLLNLLIISISVYLAKLSVDIDTFFNFSGYYSSISRGYGLTIMIIGGFFRLLPSLEFYRKQVSILTLKAQHVLITEGFFSVSRNPLYIGILLIFLGCLVFIGTISGILMWIVSFILCNWWVKYREEYYMKQVFGDEYRKYTERTPRWLRLIK
ncbi:methyltransferase family protein [Kordia antarctica]